MADSSKDDLVLQALRSYCVLHPRAADTLEGVRAWLPAKLRTRSDAEIGRALEALRAEGAVTRRQLHDGTIIFFSSGRPLGST